MTLAALLLVIPLCALAITLFDEQSNRTDEECVTKVAEVVRERDRLRQHLHDEHQRHIGTMDERDALAALLREARDDWIKVDRGAIHEEVAVCRDICDRIHATLKEKT